MEHPEVVYWFLVAVLALPSSLFSRVAAVVVLARMVSQITYQLGAPEPATNLFIYGFAALAAFAVARRASDYSAAALFVPLTATMWYWSTGDVPPVQGYWVMYAFNVAQLLFLPFGVSWPDIWDSLRARKAPEFFPPYEFRDRYV